MNKDGTRGGISYEDYLSEHDTLTYTNTGVSMMPLLRQGKDMFTVQKKGPERCKPGDVVLYRRLSKMYILHRVIAVREKDYVILGDNCTALEYGIQDSDILGIMTGYVRRGKTHTINEPGYRLYSWGKTHLYRIRIHYRRAMGKIRRAMSRSKKHLTMEENGLQENIEA